MVSEARKSSVVIVTRGTADDVEIFWARRRHELRFLGGFHAFFGGTFEDGDGEVPMSGPSPSVDRAFYGCAARELFEEIGLLVLDDEIARTGVEHAFDVRGLREDLLETRIEFPRELSRAGLRIDPGRFIPIGRWVTPEFFALRFDSEYFVVHLTGPELERLQADGLGDELQESELLDGEWVRPDDALSRWLDGDIFITPPIRRVLEAFVEVDDPRDADVAPPPGDSFGVDAFLAKRGVWLVSLRSPTIPPATHTNAAIVGEDEFVVIDPGSPYEEEQALLERLVAELIDEGRTPRAIVPTHHHPDHVGGIGALTERFDLPVWAHERFFELVDAEFEPDRVLADEERIDLGDDSLVVLETPGHASDHLCLLHERSGAVFAGDLVAAHGTILINPPDGHMGDYLDSLQRVRDLEPTALYPAHGWIVVDAVGKLDYYVDHRLEREEKVHDALVDFDAPAEPSDLVPRAYDDAPKKVWPIAARSAEAHLVHLVELGRARVVGDRYVAT